MDKFILDEDTIVAISTPIGEGGIGIVRMSGSNSLKVAQSVFKGVKAKTLISRFMTYGHILDEKGDIIDEVLLVYMKAPTTYTGEDMVEINCHGGNVPLRRILNLLLSKGCRLADRGEFTKRGFINGRIDLTQAEAVVDLISAKTDDSYNVAMSQLQGNLSRKIHELREMLVDVLVNVTVNIDYPDEDIEVITYEKIYSDLENIKKEIFDLIETSERGRILREGVKIAIVGKPNVGKSSLMNSLLNEERAIVTDIEGTTRDTIEETLNIRGIPVILVDTAGIRDTEDMVEQIGVERSKGAISQADMIFFIIDGSRPLTKEDREIGGRLEGQQALILINKTDLPQNADVKQIEKKFNYETIEISTKTGKGLSKIEDKIESLVTIGGHQNSKRDSVLVSNVRHKRLLEEAFNFISDAMTAIQLEEPLEIIEIDVKTAYENLGEIVGETVEGDIIDKVFERFCLGK